MKKDSKSIGDGGPGEKKSPATPDDKSDPALQKENRQAVKNQGIVKPEDYPERTRKPG